jgi:hypothetical protein
MTVDPPAGPGAPLLRPGDGVVLLYTPGAVPGAATTWSPIGSARRRWSGCSPWLTGQFLAQEIMRSAVGTAGLVASVPITTSLGVLVADLSASEAAGAAWSAGR